MRGWLFAAPLSFLEVFYVFLRIGAGGRRQPCHLHQRRAGRLYGSGDHLPLCYRRVGGQLQCCVLHRQMPGSSTRYFHSVQRRQTLYEPGKHDKKRRILKRRVVVWGIKLRFVPLGPRAYDRANTTLCVVVTNALTGKAEYMYPKDFHKRGCPILRASCALPGATKGVVLGKDRYFDGGVTDSIPLAHAYEDGCQKAVVVLTQDRNYQKQPMGHARLIRRIFRKYPLMTRAILNRYKYTTVNWKPCGTPKAEAMPL